MPFEWLLIALPVIFLLGWFAARMDIRHIRKSAAELPRAYLRGLTELLGGNEERALDAFSDIARQDTLPSELQFVVGELSRRRGDYRRALQTHRQLHLNEKLSSDDRNRALWELARDCAAMGFVDAAEHHARLLAQTPDYQERVFNFLLNNYQSRHRTADALALIEQTDPESRQLHQTTAAHLYCQLYQDGPAADPEPLHTALTLAPRCARARLLLAAAPTAAPSTVTDLHTQIAADTPHYLFLAASDCLRTHATPDNPLAGAPILTRWLRDHPTPMLFRTTVALLEQHSAPSALIGATIADYLAKSHHLSAAAYYVEHQADVTHTHHWLAVKKALLNACPPAFTCDHCAYEMNHFAWQCPCCLRWETLRQP